MKKLKSIDFKALFIDHGEKMGFGVILLTVFLVFLPGMSSGWGRFTQTPDELKAKIDQAAASIDSPSNNWPQAKKDQFAVIDFTDKARDIFKGLPVQNYEFSTPMFWPLYRKKEKSKEPEYLAPQFLIAEPGLAALAISTAPAFDTNMASDEAVKPGESSLPDNFKSPAGAGAAGARGAGMGPGMPAGPAGAGHSGPGAASHSGSGTPKASGGGAARKNSPSAGPSASHGSSPPGGSDAYAAMMGSSAMGMPGGRAGGSVTARGVRYVAVRAIVPVWEQQNKVMRALNLTSREDASTFVEYTDFVLERQAAIAGPDPWAGKWEVVKTESALELLSECADLEPDPVSPEVQDAVFTMGLPSRLVEYWGDHATHPNIKNFQLPKEEMEREMKLHAKLVEEYEKLQLEAEPKVKKKGLAAVQNDFRGMARQLQKSAEGSNAMKSMQNYMAEGGNRQMGVQDIQTRLNANGRLYLFRYFDFDVQPGMAYRYRVKLELRNPNFERPYEEVENPDFTRDPYRETGWSNISSVAVVPESVHYFLKDVERDPSLDDKRNTRPFASISMFEWDQKLGTILNDTLRILTVGQFIADKAKKTWVLDPGTPSLEEKEVPLVTDDVLVDARGDLTLSPDLHPDLALKLEAGRGTAKVGIRQEALVVSSLGRLKELDPVSELPLEQALTKRVNDERRVFEYLKNVPKEAAGPAGENNAFQKMMSAGQSKPSADTQGPQSKKPRNALLKGRGARGS